MRLKRDTNKRNQSACKFLRHIIRVMIMLLKHNLMRINFDICGTIFSRFGKQIRYASRKARADTRKRVKGRFVKSGENFEYDPSLVM